jgi:KDO2-lipid IV(A) lauroyltransferase
MTVLLRLLGQLPLVVLHALGTLLGWATYLGSPTYRRHLRENLELACPGAGMRLRLAAAAEAGKGGLETLRVWFASDAALASMVREVRGWEAVEAARRAGRGLILVSPHMGSFELFVAFLFLRGCRSTALYRPHRHALVQDMIERGRGRFVRLAPAGLSGVRALLAALRRREIVFVLPDQVPTGGQGQWLPFFGRMAYTMTLVGRLTAQMETETFMVFGERLPRGRGFRLHFLPPAPPLAGSVEERARAINENVESLVRMHPAQYLWGYNRYKVPAGVRAPAPATRTEEC